MAYNVLIIGKSGTGKSTSIRTLDPKETFIIQVVNKPLPFKGAKKNYTLYNKTTNPNGNRYVVDDYSLLVKLLKYIEMREDIKNIIIDDATYLMAKHFFNSTTTGYNKFDEIAKQFQTFISTLEHLKNDLFVFLMGHQEEDSLGNTKFKTVGKMVDNYLNVEGMFTVVLNTVAENDTYNFATQTNGYNTTKSPMGMFENKLIPNDLQYVKNKILDYENSEEE